jgi:hypothetical protein
MELLWFILAITVGITLLGFFLDVAFALIVFALRLIALAIIIPIALVASVHNKLRYGTWDHPNAPKEEHA